MKNFLFILILLFLGEVEKSFCQNDEKCFTTGMKWKEATVEDGSPVDWNNYHLYEIGMDTFLCNNIYNKIFIDGAPANLWVREEGGMVYLLSDEYPGEFRLYDFNWDNNAGIISTEYLQDNETGVELKKLELSNNYKVVSAEGKEYQYHIEGDGTVIRYIGRVYELNRNSCLLGYKLPETILPGLIYWKVLWIEKGGNIVFQSDSPDEWMPYRDDSAIKLDMNSVSSYKKNNLNNYNLQGRYRMNQSTHGVYIHDGKKIISQ